MYSTHYIQELRGITEDNHAQAEIVNGGTEVFFGKIIIKAWDNTVKSFFFYTVLLYICKKNCYIGSETDRICISFYKALIWIRMRTK